ncbi:MAG: CARDB domain-containing protein, partial [Burkholderiales bacterium]
MDKGQAGETNITSVFFRPSNSNIWTAANYNLPVGARTFYVEGRFVGAFCLSKLSSDSQQLVVSAPPLADLVVTALNVVPTSPSTADPTTATIVIANQGGVPAGATVANVTRNGTPIGTVNVPPLNSGGNVTLTQNLTFLAAGTYTIAVTVDPNDTIVEASNSNNSATVSTTVRDCSASDRIAALNAARQRIARGDSTIDLDGDCVNEYRRVYGTGGQLIREEIDTNQNGVPEMVWDHSSSTRTFTVDENEDGVIEYSEQAYIDTANPDVVHVTVTEDTSDDGVPDYRVTYAVDSASNVIQIQHANDNDQNGSFSSTHTSTTTREQPFGGLLVDKQGVWACSDQEEQQIKNAYNQMLSEGWSCLNGMSPRFALDFMLTHARSNIKVSCLPTQTPCGTVDTYRARWRWLLGFDELPILLGKGNFDGSGTCRPLRVVLFHELLHYEV